MRERRKDRERLEHILAAIERVLRYTKGKTYDDLVADDMMYYAVVKNIEIMGEAANMVSKLHAILQRPTGLCGKRHELNTKTRRSF